MRNRKYLTVVPVLIILCSNVFGQDNYNTSMIGQVTIVGAHDVAISGSHAYMAGDSGLHIIDTSTPSSPQEVGYFETGDHAYGVTVSGSYAYVACGTRWGGSLSIIDISNPFSPQEVGIYDDIWGKCSGVAVNGNYVYAAVTWSDLDVWSGGLLIIDISDPSSPQEVGFFFNGSYTTSIAVSGIYAYVTSQRGYTSGLYIIDVSTPFAPQEVGSFEMAGLWEGSVTVSGSYAYVGGVRIIDISSPSSPQEVGLLGTGGGARSVTVSGSYVYVVERLVGLRIIDVSNPSSPQEVGFFDTGNEVLDVAVSGNYAYVADREDGLYIIRNDLLVLSNDEEPSIPESFTLEQNYPNPFNPTTTIQYSLPGAEQVKLTVFDIRGQEVITLQDDVKPPGNYEVQWNGNDATGNPVSTGIYFCRIVAGEYSQTIKMTYLR